ncbi:Uncharacterised protein [Mycobacterium tuberculosis]|nr:Uncharacterised protein [Mycobacterium tuberculosis]
MVVLPVPGGPANTKWCVRWATVSPRCLRTSSMATELFSRDTWRLTSSRPMNSASWSSASCSSAALRSWAAGSTKSSAPGSVAGSHGSVRASIRPAVVVTIPKLVSDSACSTCSFSG